MAARIEVDVRPDLLRKLRERAGRTIEQISEKRGFERYQEWEEGRTKPTVRQAIQLAKTFGVPYGFLVAGVEPPERRLPEEVADFRIDPRARETQPSDELLDIVNLCLRRQQWYREWLIENDAEGVSIAGTYTERSSPVDAARDVASRLAALLRKHARTRSGSRVALPTQLTRTLRDAGILVMCVGYVPPNTRRSLSEKEFRGFALADRIAPLIFVNTSDSVAGSAFTLAHELAHVVLGKSALDDVDPRSALTDAQALSSQGRRVERWCNRFAAEFLAPADKVKHLVASYGGQEHDQLAKVLSREFGISIMAALVRLHELDYLERDAFEEMFERAKREAEDAMARKPKKKGGSPRTSFPAQADPNFALAVTEAAFSDRMPLREALFLLGIGKVETLINRRREILDWHRDRVAGDVPA